MLFWLRAAKAGLAALHGLPQGVRVLVYHGVIERYVDPVLERNFTPLRVFRDHVRLLRRWRPVTLTEMELLCYGTGGDVPRGVLVTFDDGYRNNLVAFEILRSARIPAAMFVVANCLGPGRLLWTAELSLLLLHGSRRSVEALGRKWSLGNREERVNAFHSLRGHLKGLAAQERRAVMEELREQFPCGELETLAERFSAFRMCEWADVIQLSAAGFEIGSHGWEHEIHHAAQPALIRQVELVSSKAEIERRVGRPCRYFAYPNGNWLPSSGAELTTAGYALGFTTQLGLATKGVLPWAVPRLGAAGSLEGLVRVLIRPC